MDIVLGAMVGPLDEAMLHRDEILFQLLEMRDELLAIIKSADGQIEVWRSEVEELYAWRIRGGELEVGEKDGEAKEDVEVEDVRDDGI